MCIHSAVPQPPDEGPRKQPAETRDLDAERRERDRVEQDLLERVAAHDGLTVEQVREKYRNR